ncbi:hypothetical protein Leryth_021132 [Lithospermum erythrorhizon]|nr:hypothetical protein Leryth_021132 [Lithospermum erythrorhizon]
MNQSSQQNTAKAGTEVFVGGLPVTVTEEKIHEVIFSVCGEIVEVRLIKDHKGHVKVGYCFVRFATKEAADRAIKEKSECLDKISATCPLGYFDTVDGKKIGVLPSAEQNTLFLGNLNKGWNAEEFEKFVRQIFPDVVLVTLVMLGGDVQPGQKLRNRGFGFVKFSSHAHLASVETTMGIVANALTTKISESFIYSQCRSLQEIESDLLPNPQSQAAARAYRAGSAAEFVLAGTVHPSVKWAEEESETDPEELAKIKIAFVRDLPATADENYTRKLFEPCGKVDKVMLHRRGNSQIGFIYFDKRQDLDNALKEMNGKVVQGPQEGSPFKLQVELAKPMDKKRKRAPEDLPSKSPTIVQSQSTLPQNYLRVHSSGAPATRIQKVEVQHADSYENAVVALPLAVKERLLRILRLGIASRFDIDEHCLFRLKELPESNAISVLDQFMLSGAEMQDKGAFLADLISKNLVNRVGLDQVPLSLSRETSTLSREPVLSALSRRTHLPEVDYMVNNKSLASHFDSTDARSDIYRSRYPELHSKNYLSSHSMLGRMRDGSISDTTTISSIGNARGRLSSDVSSLADYNLSPLRSTSSYTGNPRIGLRSSLEGYVDRSRSPLHSIEDSRVHNVRIGLNSHTNGPVYESVSPTHIMPRSTAYGRVGLTHTAASDWRTMEMAPTSSISYNKVSSLLDEPTTANSQKPRHQVRFDPYTGEPYRFDPFTGEPILPENASRHN